MTQVLRRFRGLAIALAVLAISAGAVFASAPRFHQVSNPTAEEPTASPTETPGATETPEPTETPEATETPEPTETPEATETPETPEASESPNADSHGALVSAAAQMPTPAGFPNHGAWVRCVAHMDGTLATVDFATITPESCGITTDPAATGKSKATEHGQAGKDRAAKAKSHGHGGGHN